MISSQVGKNYSTEMNESEVMRGEKGNVFLLV